MNTKLFLLAGLLLTGSSVSFAQTDTNTSAKENEFSMSLQIRSRAEYRNGALTPRYENQQAAVFINDRNRLSLAYARKGLKMGLSVQNTGVWGDMPQINKSSDVSVYEAWGQISSDNGLFAKFGRQVLSYDDERILGALDWNVNGRSHDALKLGFENPVHKLNAVLAFNQNSERVIGGTYYTPQQPYKTMQTLWYHYDGSAVFKPSVLFMNLGFEKGNQMTGESELANLQTIGTFMTIKTSPEFDLNFSAYYQTGNNTSNNEVSAYMLSLRGIYSVDSQWTLSAGTDYLSGEGNQDDNETYNAFNPLYGTHHKFYGSMDYFYASSYARGLNPGLWDTYMGVGFKPHAKLGLSANYHYFSITTDIYNAAEKIKRGLGSEIDFQMDWTVMKDVMLSCGYSTMFGTSSMDYVKSGNHSAWQDWGWISININPQIFSTKWR